MYIKNKSLATKIDLKTCNFNDFLVIDIRSRGYFLISHVKNAINIESLQRITFIAQENPDKKILLYCHSGATAADFGDKLIEQGLKNIYYIDDNYFNIPKESIVQNS